MEVKRLNLFLFFFSVRELKQQLTTPLTVLLTVLRTFVFILADTHANKPTNSLKQQPLKEEALLIVIFAFPVILSLISE